MGRKSYLAMGRRLTRTEDRRMRGGREAEGRGSEEGGLPGAHRLIAFFGRASQRSAAMGMPERVAAHGAQAGEGGLARK